VNPDVDGYTKTPNHLKRLQKQFRKTQESDNLLKTKEILNT